MPELKGKAFHFPQESAQASSFQVHESPSFPLLSEVVRSVKNSLAHTYIYVSCGLAYVDHLVLRSLNLCGTYHCVRRTVHTNVFIIPILVYYLRIPEAWHLRLASRSPVVWSNEDTFDNNDKKLLANDMNHDCCDDCDIDLPTQKLQGRLSLKSRAKPKTENDRLFSLFPTPS